MTEAAPYSLSPARQADADALHQMLCLPQVCRYLADGAPPPRAITDAWLDKSAVDFERHEVGLWLLHGGQELAGCVLLDVLDTLPGNAGPKSKKAAELTYVLHPEHWGKGLATRMAWTVITHAFDVGVDVILAGVDSPNTASRAVIKRLGMKFYRTVRYTLGQGEEYLLWANDPPPASKPAFLPISERPAAGI